MSHNGTNPDRILRYPTDPTVRALVAWRTLYGWEAEPPRWLRERAAELIAAGWDEFAAVKRLQEGEG